MLLFGGFALASSSIILFFVPVVAACSTTFAGVAECSPPPINAAVNCENGDSVVFVCMASFV